MARTSYAQRRKIYERAMAWKAEREAARTSDGCPTCKQGVHDPSYRPDGVCCCRCCGWDMTDDEHPKIEGRADVQLAF